MAYFSIYLVGLLATGIHSADFDGPNVFKLAAGLARHRCGTGILDCCQHSPGDCWAFDPRHAKSVSPKSTPSWSRGSRWLPISGINRSNLRRSHLSWLFAATIYTMDEECVYWNHSSEHDLRCQPCVPRRRVDANDLPIRLSLWTACTLAGQSSPRDDGPFPARWDRWIAAGIL